MLLVGGALVATSAAASAHVYVAPTHLTIHHDDGEVFGMLVGRPACRPGRTIELLVDGETAGSTGTDAAGRYRSDVPADAVTLQTRFAGIREGAHPHRHVCLGSASRSIALTEVEAAGGGRSIPPVATGPDTAAFTGSSIVPAAVLAALAALGVLLLLVGRRGRTG
jgi:hypothetical protein